MLLMDIQIPELMQYEAKTQTIEIGSNQEEVEEEEEQQQQQQPAPVAQW